jgi:membrane-associated phospholipid phosphatase
MTEELAGKRQTASPLQGADRWWTASVLIACGLLVLPLDVPIAWYFVEDHHPGEFGRVIRRSEFFGHAYGVLGVLFTVYVLDPRARRCLWRVLACTFTAGLASDLLKAAVHRTRPRWHDFELGSLETFQGWSLAAGNDLAAFLDSSNHSFPSAHTASAVALAWGLSWLYPQGRTWFLTLAAAVGISRVEAGAHFPSDVFWGAAVGHLVAGAYLGSSALSDWFSRWESRPVFAKPVEAGSTPRRAA